MSAFALVFAFMIGGAFPAGTQTSWMEPAAFHFEIGMTRSAVEKTIEESGWKSEPGKYSRQLLILYAEKKTVTLGFVDDRLQSVRFELVDFIPAVKTAHVERMESLTATFGYEGTKKTDGVLVFDHAVPNVMVVISTKPDSSFGRQGLGFLSVRYYDPSAERLIQ